jgi:hypothetical protein
MNIESLTIEEACRTRWDKGRITYGTAEFVGDPLRELYEEQLDSLNYCDELVRRGVRMAAQWKIDLLPLAQEIQHALLMQGTRRDNVDSE